MFMQSQTGFHWEVFGISVTAFYGPYVLLIIQPTVLKNKSTYVLQLLCSDKCSGIWNSFL